MYGGLGLIWLICFYQIFKKERKGSRAKFKVTEYLISVVSVLTLVPVIAIFVYYQQKLNVPTLIKAQRHGLYADFKIDGTYIIKTGSWASKVHLYGNYTLHDSIIEIDTCCVGKVLSSNMFLIKQSNLVEERRKPNYESLETAKYLVQIDKAGNEIRSRQIFEDTLPYRFEIVVDHTR